MSYQIKQSDTFRAWQRGLRDKQARAAILKRMARVNAGNFGDHKSLGDGISEMRVDVGQGYRMYYTIRGQKVVFLLCGGDKSSQSRDIAQAKKMLGDIKS